MIVRHDTLLSISCDRPQSSFVANCDIPFELEARKSHTLTDSISTLCEIVMRVSRAQEAGLSHSLAMKFIDQMQAVQEQAQPHLHRDGICRSLKQHLESAALNIHVHYAICNISNTSLRALNDWSTEMPQLLEKCLTSAVQVIRSYLNMHRLSPKVCRSWAFASNVVACMDILLVPGGQAHNNVRDLSEELVKTFEEDGLASQWYDEDGVRRSSGLHAQLLPHLRAIRDRI